MINPSLNASKQVTIFYFQNKLTQYDIDRQYIIQI